MMTDTICPMCKTYLLKEVSLTGGWGKKRKIITFYCPSCSFENKHEFEISKDEFDIELKKKQALVMANKYQIEKKWLKDR